MKPAVDDFDDGGTPEWRRRHRIIEVGPKPGFRARWKKLSFGQQAIIMGFVCLLPFIVIIVGLAFLAVLVQLRLI